MVDSMSESLNLLVLEQVMMCVLPSTEDTIWDFDTGNQWAFHVSMEMLYAYVISFRMDKKYLLCIQNRQFLSYTITLAIFGSKYLSYKASTQKNTLILIARMIPCNNLCFSALLHPVTVKSRSRFTKYLNLVFAVSFRKKLCIVL